MIELVRPNTPNPELLRTLLSEIATRGHYTNHGPLVHRLEGELKKCSSHEHFLYTANGTLALQLALKAYAPQGEVLTTPFSYVATTNAALWQGNQVRFIDLLKGTFFPDPEQLKRQISNKTAAILLTSVYGLPGPIEAYRHIADSFGVPLILDAAHAFDVKWKGKPLDFWADVACYSFHATKTFHTVEGGGLVVSDKHKYEQLFNFRSFGHRGDQYLEGGINAKGSEVHAAYGLAQLPEKLRFRQRRAFVFKSYQEAFLSLPFDGLQLSDELDWNYGYFPMLLESSKIRKAFQESMEQNGIRTRRYFYPSLNQLPHLSNPQSCPNAEDLSERIVCIPLHGEITEVEVLQVIDAVKGFWS